MAQTPAKSAEPSLGRLKSSFGLNELWQVALLLPNSWDDLTHLYDRFNVQIPRGESCAVAGRLDGAPEVRFTNGAPRLIGYLIDASGYKLGFSAFGDTRELEKSLLSLQDRVILFGQMDSFDGRYWLKSPEIVSEGWIGRLRPRYPGKTGVIKPETVRERVLKALKAAIPQAVGFLDRELASFGSRQQLAEIVGVPGWSLETIIYQAHIPKTLEFGQKAQRSMEYFAALGIIKTARSNQGAGQGSAALPLAPWRPRAAKIPFALTDEQERAIEETLADLASLVPMRRILSGDVGTGKTAVYGCIASSIVDANGTAAVLLPNGALASQVAQELTTWWPDLPLQLITGANPDEEICGSIVVGTTAILHRDLGHPSICIVDEQQKFARGQREQFVGPDTHLLEVTATCIPRSAALARYGVVKVSKLTKCHTPKTIHTRIWHKSQWNELFEAVKDTIRKGGQVLFVYPLREKGEEEENENTENTRKKLELRSAEEIYHKWSKMLPGLVRWVHGQMSADEKNAALADMREGKASVLIGTTVVEVGLTIPRLRRIVVVHPDRHGLTTLHQLRGRVARHGGEGWCDLFLPYPVKEETMQRLRVLETTQDGFKIAEADMQLRGIGDLSQASNKQSGADETFLFGRSVRMDILDEVMEKVN